MKKLYKPKKNKNERETQKLLDIYTRMNPNREERTQMKPKKRTLNPNEGET